MNVSPSFGKVEIGVNMTFSSVDLIILDIEGGQKGRERKNKERWGEKDREL